MDQIYNSQQATSLEAAAVQEGDVLIWPVFEHPIDYPGLYVARPHSTRQNRPFQVVLVAANVEELRSQLPPGLVMLARHADDNPKIIEVWF